MGSPASHSFPWLTDPAGLEALVPRSYGANHGVVRDHPRGSGSAAAPPSVEGRHGRRVAANGTFIMMARAWPVMVSPVIMALHVILILKGAVSWAV